MPEQTLTDDLRALGRAAQPDVDVDGLAARVVDALALPGPAPARPRVGRRVALVALAVLVAVVATPPVRATVAEWFGFGAVRVEPGGSPAPEPPDVPPVESSTSLEDAAARVDFPLVAPAVLGQPDGVETSDDGGRVSLSWSRGGRTVRLDQLAGTPDYAMVKTAPRLRFASVDGRDVLWFPTAHTVALLDADGAPTGEFRVADRTMLVPLPDSTVRLEGRLTFTEAADLARSLQPVR
jgi:hypothetical protein